MIKVLKFALRHLTEGMILLLFICLIGIYVHTWADVNGEGGLRERVRVVERTQDLRAGDRNAIEKAIELNSKSVERQIESICATFDTRFNVLESLIETLIGAIQTKGVSIPTDRRQIQEG